MPFKASVLVVAIVALCVRADANMEGAAVPDHGPRKLAQSDRFNYFDKSACVKAAVYSFETDSFLCDKGHTACCGPSNDKCYGRKVDKFRCKVGDNGQYCCNA